MYIKNAIPATTKFKLHACCLSHNGSSEAYIVRDNIAKYPKYWHKKTRNELAPLPPRTSSKQRKTSTKDDEDEGDKVSGEEETTNNEPEVVGEKGAGAKVEAEANNDDITTDADKGEDQDFIRETDGPNSVDLD